MIEPWMEPNLFLVLLVGLGGPLLAVLGLAFDSLRGLQPWKAAVLPVVLALAAAWGAAAAALGQPAGIWLPLLGLAGLCGAAWVVRWRPVLLTGKWVAAWVCRPRVCWVLLLLACPVLAFGWALRVELQADSSNSLANLVFLTEAPALEPVTAIPARTDRDRPVPLYTSSDQSLPLPQVLAKEKTFLQSPNLSDRLIRTAAPDPSYNCHGWVFTGGRFWVKGAAVEPILEDNGYYPVSGPRAGDLAVYRDDQGAIVHTGLVRAAAGESFILIESKWGRLGRYVHAPHVHCYPAGCTYYRSPRAGHLLQGVDGGADWDADSDEAPDS